MTPPFLYHEQLTLQNFTAFSNQTLDFVPGINVLIGENGTGKTHVLKVLYAWQMARHLVEVNRPVNYASIFAETYGVNSVGELHRSKSKIASASGRYGGNEWGILLQNKTASDSGLRPSAPRPVFIPAIEMLAHARNMNGIMRDYADFDRTCFDFLAMVTAQPYSTPAERYMEQLRVLRDLVPGEVEWDQSEQRFFLVEKGKRLPFSLVAEGARKVTALYRLIELHWILPGGVLFWDKPEVNLNPRWMDEVIETLVVLARSGVQIFLATHSYVILKQIDLTLRAQHRRSGEGSQARFFSLYRERGVTRATRADDFASLQPNSILDQYDQMLADDWRLADQVEDAA